MEHDRRSARRTPVLHGISISSPSSLARVKSDKQEIRGLVDMRRYHMKTRWWMIPVGAALVLGIALLLTPAAMARNMGPAGGAGWWGGPLQGGPAQPGHGGGMGRGGF